MDDYKRALLMRVRNRLMNPKKYHCGLCDSFADQLEIDGAVINDYDAFFIQEFNYEMDQLFDHRQWEPGFQGVGYVSQDIDQGDYWWYPSDWVEPRIAMIDFLLNNR